VVALGLATPREQSRRQEGLEEPFHTLISREFSGAMH
jgi:hypothetical protein